MKQKPLFDQADALGIAFFMGEHDSSWSAVDAGDYAVIAAVAMQDELGENLTWGEEKLPDWESFLSEYVRALDRALDTSPLSASACRVAVRNTLKKLGYGNYKRAKS